MKQICKHFMGYNYKKNNKFNIKYFSKRLTVLFIDTYPLSTRGASSNRATLKFLNEIKIEIQKYLFIYSIFEFFII